MAIRPKISQETDVELSTFRDHTQRINEDLPRALARQTAAKVASTFTPGAYKPSPVRALHPIAAPGSSVSTRSNDAPEALMMTVNEPDRMMVTVDPAEPVGMMVVVGEPKEFRVYNGGNNGASSTIKSCCAKETDKAKACFERIKAETFDHLCRTGVLRKGDWEHFKLDVGKDRIGTWDCGGEGRKIDYLTDLWTPTIQNEFKIFDTLFLDKRPRGMSREPVYHAGYMSDVSAKNGFAITSPQVREKLPKTMGQFAEGHLGRMLGAGATPADYYNKMRDIAIMDAHRKAAISATEKEIRKLDRAIIRLGEGPHNPQTKALMEKDKKKLEGVLENLRASDQFAVNFAACFNTTKTTRIEAAHELSKAAKKHLEGIETKGWIRNTNLDLQPSDREYCDLMGTFVLEDRVNGFSTYCDQKRIARGNTAIEHNFLLANLQATLRGHNELQGMELFEGLHNPKIAESIRTSILREGRDRATDIFVTASDIAANPATLPPDTKPAKVMAHFREHVYREGWE